MHRAILADPAPHHIIVLAIATTRGDDSQIEPEHVSHLVDIPPGRSANVDSPHRDGTHPDVIPVRALSRHVGLDARTRVMSRALNGQKETARVETNVASNTAVGHPAGASPILAGAAVLVDQIHLTALKSHPVEADSHQAVPDTHHVEGISTLHEAPNGHPVGVTTPQVVPGTHRDHNGPSRLV